MNDEPTVKSAELTDTDAFANPVIVVLPAANVVMPEAAPAIVKLDPPCMVLVALTNPVIVVLPAANVVMPDAAPAIVKLEPPWIVLVALTNPVTVVLPAANVVIPDTAPANDPVLADNTNLPILLPNNIVLEVGTIAVVFATSPVVVKLAALIVPV